jgi:hypothetical protein
MVFIQTPYFVAAETLDVVGVVHEVAETIPVLVEPVKPPLLRTNPQQAVPVLQN